MDQPLLVTCIGLPAALLVVGTVIICRRRRRKNDDKDEPKSSDVVSPKTIQRSPLQTALDPKSTTRNRFNQDSHPSNNIFKQIPGMASNPEDPELTSLNGSTSDNKSSGGNQNGDIAPVDSIIEASESIDQKAAPPIVSMEDMDLGSDSDEESGSSNGSKGTSDLEKNPMIDLVDSSKEVNTRGSISSVDGKQEETFTDVTSQGSDSEYDSFTEASEEIIHDDKGEENKNKAEISASNATEQIILKSKKTESIQVTSEVPPQIQITETIKLGDIPSEVEVTETIDITCEKGSKSDILDVKEGNLNSGKECMSTREKSQDIVEPATIANTMNVNSCHTQSESLKVVESKDESKQTEINTNHDQSTPSDKHSQEGGHVKNVDPSHKSKTKDQGKSTTTKQSSDLVTDSKDTCDYLEFFNKSCVDVCLLCYKDTMSAMGVRSQSLDTFVTKTSFTLGSLCSNHKVKLKRQNTDPGVDDPANRAIRIVRVSSVDSSDLKEAVGTPESVKNEDKDSEADSAMGSMIIKDSLEDSSVSVTDDSGVQGKQSSKQTQEESVHVKSVDTGSSEGQKASTGELETPKTEGVNVDKDKIQNNEKEGVKPDISSENSMDTKTEKSSKEESQSTDKLTKSENDDKPISLTDLVDEKVNKDIKSLPGSTPEAIMNILFDLGQRLAEERSLRLNAEDWADFLTDELDAHIDSRTSAEEKCNRMREQMIKMKDRHRKLQDEHKALVLQLHDLTVDGDKQSPAQKENILNKSRVPLRRNKTVGDKDTVMAKRQAMMIRGSQRKSSHSNSDSGEDNTDQVSKDVHTPAKSMDDIRHKFQNGFFKRKNQEKSNDSVSSAHTDINISDLLSETSDQDKFKRDIPSHDKYTTSTPIKSETNETSKTNHLKPNNHLSPPGPPAEGEQGDGNVSVKAFTNMWEEKLSQIPFKTMTSTQKDINGDIRKLPETRCSESSSEHGSTKKRDKNDNFEDDDDSDDDEFFDADFLSMSQSSLDVPKSEDVLTDSISAKQALNMWEKYTASMNSSAEHSKSTSNLSFSGSGSVNQVRAKIEGLTPSSSHGDISGEANSSHEGDFVLERLNKFSVLKSRFEKKVKVVDEEPLNESYA